MNEGPAHGVADRLKILGTGMNWMNVGSIIAVSLCSYYSPLPQGSTVSVVTMDPGVGAMESPNMVAEGRYHIGMTTPAWWGQLAVEGRTPFAKPLPLRGIALFPHDDRMVFAVRSETGLRSIRDIKERKYPLRYSIPTVEKSHPAIWALDEILALYGFSRKDIDAWGGRELRDRPKDMTNAKVQPVSEEWEALFDEAVMSVRWRNLTELYDVTFLPVEEEVLRTLEARGMPRGVIAKNRFRSVAADVPTLDFSDWLMFCRDDLDEDVAYHLASIVDEKSAAFNERIPSGLTSRVDCSVYAPRIPIPLHPGAKRYYQERGYLA